MTRLFRSLDESFWLRPAILTFLAIVTAGVISRLERLHYVPTVFSRYAYGGGRDAAASLLSSISAASLGVAGTVFSITIAALTLASGQMGPRLLRAFTGDRSVQWSLGVFVGTYAYCLVVLRELYQGDDPDFVPPVAVTGGVLLAFLGIATLVYLVHHIAKAINVQHVITTVDADMHREILEAMMDRAPAAVPPVRGEGREVECVRRGYCIELDEARVARAARRADVLVRYAVKPGEFLLPRTPLAHIETREGRAAPPNRRLDREVLGAIQIGARRTVTQDPEFAIRNLVELAVRALSPGINDPYTAIAVLDHLGAGLSALATGELFDGATFDRKGTLRVVRPVADYAGIVDVMFHMIRQYGATSPAVTIHLMEVLGLVLEAEDRPERREVLARQAQRLRETVEIQTYARGDLADLDHRAKRFYELLAEPPEGSAESISGQS